MQQINFIKNFEHSGNRILQSFALRTVSLEIIESAQKYLIANVKLSTFVAKFSKMILKYFNDEVSSV